MKTFAVVTSAHACTELIVETNHLRSYLQRADYEEVKRAEEADLILVSTCSFNQHFEDEAHENITQSLKNRKEGARVIVSGCYSKIAPRDFEKFTGAEPVPPLEMEKFEELVPSKVSLLEARPNSIDINELLKSDTFMLGLRIKNFYVALRRFLPFLRVPSWLDSLPMPDWYYVQAANGCLGNCTFCAIKHARGKVRSNDLEWIVAQVENAVKKGFKTVSLAATDMGCWGVDKGLTLPDLLGEIVKVKGDFLVDMHYLEPDWLIKYMPRLEPIFNTGKIGSFGSPVQSGSNRILKRMGRNYTVEEFIEAVNHVVDKTRVRSLNSIIMVGFPGETVEDYLETYHLLEKTRVSYWCLLKYEGRYNIPSEKLDGKVPEDVKDDRRLRLVRKAQLRNYVGLPDFIVEPTVRLSFGKVQ